MSDHDYDALKKQFDDFSLRLVARAREFNDRGAFAKTDDGLRKIEERHAAIEAKFAAAVHEGAAWKASKVELERDINALIEDFVHLEKKGNTVT